MKIIRYIKKYADVLGLFYVKILNRIEYGKQKYIPINERPIEYQFVFKHLALIHPRNILDVGTGITALPNLMRSCGFLVTAIDNVRDYWPSGMINRHYYVINDDITNTRLDKKFDLITCVSVLEHIKEHKKAVRSMFSLLNKGGHLIMSFPYNENKYIGNVYKLTESSVNEEQPMITQVFSRKQVDLWLDENGGMILEQEYWKMFSGEYWTCGERVTPPCRVGKEDKHQISCILMQKT